MWLEFILKYKKPLIWLTIIITVALVIVFWKRKSDSVKAIGDLTVDKTALTITQNQATIISENLLGAMNRYGTDEQTIFDNLENLRKDDLVMVMKTFGVKPYNGSNLATQSYEKMLFSTDLNLIGWLKEELSGDDLNKVKAIFEAQNIPF